MAEWYIVSAVVLCVVVILVYFSARPIEHTDGFTNLSPMEMTDNDTFYFVNTYNTHLHPTCPTDIPGNYTFDRSAVTTDDIYFP